MIRPMMGVPLENQTEQILSRIVLVDEARGERDSGGDLDAFPMLAIWNVIRNLALRDKTTMKHEILQPYQFSGFNIKGGHRNKLLNYPDTDIIAWTRADAVCDCAEKLMEAGFKFDPTFGADHYYNPKLASPKWGRGHKDWVEKCVIGSHVFGVCP